LAINYNPRIITDGLVLCLDAANPKSYGGSGTTWTDLSRNGNNGTLNGVGYSGSNLGSLSFDGTSAYANLGTATSLGFSSVRTISCWAKVSATNGGHILSMWDAVGGVNQRTFIITTYGVTNKFTSMWSPDGVADSTPLYSTSTITLNTWYNLTIVYRSGVRELWSNGDLQSTLSQATIYTSATTNRLGVGAAIARSSDTPSAFLNGSVSDVQLYNRALSAAEVKQNYDAFKGRYGLT
jgi:hypothetical protein